MNNQDDHTQFTRRNFVKMMGAGCAVAGMASPLGLLTGCSAPQSSEFSYINEIIKPQNVSPVYKWTDIMLQAMRNTTTTPPPATRAFAMAHVAGFLAVNGITGGYQTPFGLEPGASDADPNVAYGVAASMALSEALTNSYAFDRMAFLRQYPDGEAKARAVAYGKRAAEVVIKSRINDGAEPNKANFYLGRYPRREDSLQWSPTGPFYGAPEGPFLGTFNRGLLPGWGAQKPWIMKSAGDFLARPFPNIYSAEFAQQYEHVREIGRIDSTTRTEDQTEIAFFWEDGPRGVTPPGHWLIVAMRVTQDMGLSLLEQARLFALLSIGQADAAITTWHSKYTHDIIRPETVIRQRANSIGNPYIKGTEDRNWRSLIFTPDFPAYTSGHSTFSGMGARMIANVIGRDDVKFSARAPDLVNWPKQLANVKRSWTSLWQAAEENGMSRIYGGVHWDADNTEGLRVGRDLADYVYQNAFVRAI